MNTNPLKNLSTLEIESAISKALSNTCGCDINCCVSEIKNGVDGEDNDLPGNCVAITFIVEDLLQESSISDSSDPE